MKTIASVIAFLLLTAAGPASQVIIKGKVTGTDNIPLSGVVVMIKGTNITTMTGTDGCYAINAGPEAKTLIFSLRGMKPLEEPIIGRTVINVMMEAENPVAPDREKGKGKHEKKPVYDEVFEVAEEASVNESAVGVAYDRVTEAQAGAYHKAAWH